MLSLETESAIRFAVFFAVFFCMALAEIFWPYRKLERTKLTRWTANLFLLFFNSFLLRLILPLSAMAFAEYVRSQSWGILSFIKLGPILEIILSFIAFDFIIYGQHVLFHYQTLLWRLHRVHHSDVDFDVTTGGRFHFIEILLSMLIKFLAILLIGPPAIAVLIFEIALNATSMFNHTNISLPRFLDRFLRWFLVTPDMHRIHHSVKPSETNSNFGFNLTWWDRLFRTYKSHSSEDPRSMKIGLSEFRTLEEAQVLHLLLQPFSKQPTK